MRSRLAVLALTLLAAGACDNKPAERAAATLPPPPPSVEQPAAAAGGACTRLNYEYVKKAIGVRFTVAAANQAEGVSSCVLQTVDATWPDLTLAVIGSTAATADQFLDDLMPAKGIKLKGLGKAAYLLKSPASGAHGPAVEIGWLNAAKQIQTLRFTFPKSAASTAVTQMNRQLFTLAKAMDAPKS
ncbi:hypothetical protein Ade02nite_05740 [Paractinoplanes deccanensis]|uniref:DUF3558 domain-containing protein n=1 Tax=Paractinoplanes deccanensis TaxID=113561 RepID=A0ABQ3XW32_9ACTN|nr:hypothetical protein [Actinoplanes deccanensis]GID71933.1 hypothetical protein Ade02nite_05740 [Actinoplanes deccanensis]